MLSVKCLRPVLCFVLPSDRKPFDSLQNQKTVVYFPHNNRKEVFLWYALTVVRSWRNSTHSAPAAASRLKKIRTARFTLSIRPPRLLNPLLQKRLPSVSILRSLRMTIPLPMLPDRSPQSLPQQTMQLPLHRIPPQKLPSPKPCRSLHPVPQKPQNPKPPNGWWH